MSPVATAWIETRDGAFINAIAMEGFRVEKSGVAWDVVALGRETTWVLFQKDTEQDAIDGLRNMMKRLTGGVNL